MSTQWRKVLADFWSNKIRTTLMIITIMVGVFSIGFVQTTSQKMTDDMESDYQPSNPPETVIYGWPMDEDTVEMIRQLPGVGDVEGKSSTTIQWIQDSGKKVSISVEAIESPESVRVGKLKPANPAEKVLPELGEHEILLDRSANVMELNPGDLITVEIYAGKTRTLRFGGYVHDVNVIPYNFAGSLTGYVTPETLIWLGGSDSLDQLRVSVDKNPTDIEYVNRVAQAISERLKDAGTEVFYISVYNPGHHFAWEIAQGAFFIFSILGWLTVILSTVLVINTIISLITQQKRHVGIMKSIGADNGQILGMYLVLLLVFGVIAFAVSVPLAAWMGNDNPMTGMLNLDAGPFRYYPQAIILQAIVALLVPIIAALAPLLTSIRKPAYESLSFQGIDNKRVAKAEEGSISRWMADISRPVTLSIRNAFRKKARMVLTVGTLVLGGAIFISVYNLWASFDETMKQVEGYFLADINISLGKPYRYDKVGEMAETLPEVETTEGWMEISGKLYPREGDTKNEIFFVAPPSSSTMIKPVLAAGRWLTPEDENAVVMGNHLLKVRPDLKVGDWIDVELDGQKTRWQIVGQYMMPGNVNPPLLYTNYEYISRLVNEPGMIYSLRVNTKNHDATTQETVMMKLQDLFEKNKIQVSSMQTSSEWSKNQTNSTDMLVVFMMIMAVLIAVVGGVGLMGTMSINILERTREIGVMRAVGASNWDIQQMVIIEGIFVGLVSWIASCVLAIPITMILTYGVGVAILQAAIPSVFGVVGPLVWLAGTIVLSIISSSIPAHRASSLTVRDTLAYE